MTADGAQGHEVGAADDRRAPLLRQPRRRGLSALDGVHLALDEVVDVLLAEQDRHEPAVPLDLALRRHVPLRSHREPDPTVSQVDQVAE
jgi:hypothetical protein